MEMNLRSSGLTFFLLVWVWAFLVPDFLLADSNTLAPGQHLRFESFTTDEGLSQNAGLALLQDRRGFLWIATQDGLDRYDGLHFVTFRHDPQDPHSLGFNSILALYEDRDGFLWIGTWGGGLDRYDPRSGQFAHFKPDPTRPESLGHPVVTDIYQTPDGNLWVATLGGLDRWDSATQTFTHFRHNADDSQSLSSDAISIIRPAPGGKLWIGTGAFNIPGAGLNLFDPQTGLAQRMPVGKQGLPTPNVSDLVTDSKGKVWISLGGYGVVGGGLACFDPSTSMWTAVPLRSQGKQTWDNNLTSLLVDREGRLWMTSWRDGLRFLAPDGTLVQLKHDSSDPESLATDNTFSLLQDRSGVLWVGTLNTGICKANLHTLGIQTFRANARDPLSLPNNHISSFAQTIDGQIWVGTWEAGIARFDPASGRFTRFAHHAQDPTSLSSDLITTLYPDSDGSLWVGTLGAGLNHFDPQTGRSVHYRSDAKKPGQLLEDQVMAVIRDPGGRLWVSSFLGLSRLDPGSTTFVHYPRPVPITTFCLVGQELWMGTWGAGILRLDLAKPTNLDPQKAEFQVWTTDPHGPSPLLHDGVWSIVESPDGTLWFGTEGGLNRWNPTTKALTKVTTKEGLRNDTILGALWAADGLWVMTNNGLAHYNPKDGSIRTYDRFDGLQGNEFSSGALLRAHDGRLFFGGLRGFSTFYPQQLDVSAPPPPVAVTGFSVFNVPQSLNLDGSQGLTLGYEQNFFSFEFAALDFQNPKENRFAYRLEGFDQDWVQAGSRNYASYTNLPGGDYTFQVRAETRQGGWNTQGVNLRLTIVPPFWQTWPFRIGSILGLALLTWLGFQWRIRSIRKQNTQLQTLLTEQQKVEGDLRRSEARFKAIFDNSAVGIGLLSLDRIILDANPAMVDLLGYPREELVGKNPLHLTLPEDIETSSRQFQQLVCGEIPQLVTERRYVHKDGRVVWTLISLTVVRDHLGTPQYLVGLISDIDDQKRASERLAAQEAAHRQQLESRIAERTEELNLANHRLREKATQEAVIAERTRLARELHDAVTQTLFSASLIAEVVPELWEKNPPEGRRRLDEVRQLTRGALAEMRTLLVELRPNALVDIPLPTLVKQLTEALGSRSKTSLLVHIQGERDLPVDVKIGLYRLVQEALNNIIKHSRATQAMVNLQLEATVRLTVADDGVGFDLSQVTADHLGLKIMRERAESIGAELRIESEPQEGTQISIVWKSNPPHQGES